MMPNITLLESAFSINAMVSLVLTAPVVTHSIIKEGLLRAPQLLENYTTTKPMEIMNIAHCLLDKSKHQLIRVG